MPANETTEAVDLEPGKRFGEYRIIQKLGQGGFGEVHEAVWGRLDRSVALKLLRPEHTANQEFVARFMREAFMLARIDHPHVVRVVDLGQAEGLHYLALELLRGETLDAQFKREGRLSVEALTDLFVPVVSGLSCVHKLGAVHRDLKPENVFQAVQYDGTVAPKILDLGLVQTVLEPGARKLTKEGKLLGTPSFMAPEQMLNPVLVGPQTDLWSIGMMLYVGATGTNPLARDTLGATVMAVCNGELLPPSTIRPGLPSGFDQLVMGLLTRDPAARIQTARAVGHALLSFASPATVAAWGDEFGFIVAPRVQSSPPAQPAATPEVAAAGVGDARTSPVPARRPRGPVLAVSVVTTLALAAGLVLFFRHEDTSDAAPAPQSPRVDGPSPPHTERHPPDRNETPPPVRTESLPLRPAPVTTTIVAGNRDAGIATPSTVMLHVTLHGFPARPPASITFAYVNTDAGVGSIEGCTGPCDRVVAAASSVRVTARVGRLVDVGVVRDVRGDVRVVLDAHPTNPPPHPPPNHGPCVPHADSSGLLVPCFDNPAH